MMNQKISKLRKKIDKIDSQILELLSERFETAYEIGIIKREEEKKITDKSRENEIIAKLNKLGLAHIRYEFIEELFNLIFTESKRIQKL